MFLFISLSVILISCGDDDNPTSPGNTTEPLFPLAVGNEWNYDFIQYNDGRPDTGSHKIYIDESREITFKGRTFIAYHVRAFSWGSWGESESALWEFQIGTQKISVISLDDLENFSTAPLSISLNEAVKKPQIKMNGDVCYIDVANIMILGEETECITVKKYDSCHNTTLYYKLGVGIVGYDYTYMEDKRSLILKSYTVK